MAKRKTLPQIAAPDPDQIMMAGVAPVSMGERNARHHDLIGVGLRDLRQGFALGHCPPPLNIRRQA